MTTNLFIIKFLNALNSKKISSKIVKKAFYTDQKLRKNNYLCTLNK